MRVNILLIVVSTLLFVLIGCQKNDVADKDLTKTAILAKDYLKEQSYTVISYEQHQQNFEINESNINMAPWKFSLRVTDGEPEQYIGKVIDIETFIVKNHPLDHWESRGGLKSKGKVYAFVYVVEGKVVGGASFPYMPKRYDEDGGYWPLDGRTEE